MCTENTHVVARLLVLVAFLIVLGLGLIWNTLLRVESLPALAENFADLTCVAHQY